MSASVGHPLCEDRFGSNQIPDLFELVGERAALLDAWLRPVDIDINYRFDPSGPSRQDGW